MACRKIILSCVALCVFPVLAYSMAICGKDLCQSKTQEGKQVCEAVTCGDGGNTANTCKWVEVMNSSGCVYVGGQSPQTTLPVQPATGSAPANAQPPQS